jgi:hypothetical protein
MSSIETVSVAAPPSLKRAASPAHSDSAKRLSPDTPHSGDLYRKAHLSPNTRPSSPDSADTPPSSTHADGKTGITPLDALNPIHVAAASAERYHNGLREAGVMMEPKGHPERKRRASSDSMGVSQQCQHFK